MITTLNIFEPAPLHDVKIFGVRTVQQGVPEFYEFGLKYENGIIRSFNTQFRLVLDSEHPNYHELVKSGHAMDSTRFANRRAQELIEVGEKGEGVGEFVQPTFFAVCPEGTVVETDFGVILRRTDDVLANHTVVDAMRSPLTGNCSVEADGVDSVVICITEDNGSKRAIRFALSVTDIQVSEQVFVTEPLFTFAPKAGKNARRWVTDKVSQGATGIVNGQLAHNVDFLKQIPRDAFLWFAPQSARYFSMPARWSSKHVRFEARSPHRTTALRAAGIMQEQPARV